MKPLSQSVPNQVRVQHGIARERQIAKALKEQAGLSIIEASQYEDTQRKVDRWLVRDGQRIGLQIKFRESGDDLLFEVFDRWFDWNDPRNKLGRDMQGDAQLYAVLLTDKRTVSIIPLAKAKELVHEIVKLAQQHGWTTSHLSHRTFRYFLRGNKLELKVQRDPHDGRQKMVAYIPAAVFENVENYHVKLPKKLAA